MTLSVSGLFLWNKQCGIVLNVLKVSYKEEVCSSGIWWYAYSVAGTFWQEVNSEQNGKESLALFSLKFRGGDWQ